MYLEEFRHWAESIEDEGVRKKITDWINRVQKNAWEAVGRSSKPLQHSIGDHDGGGDAGESPRKKRRLGDVVTRDDGGSGESA